jgi:membrane protease subunit HflC
MRRWFIITLVAFLGLLLAQSSILFVDQTEYVYVTRFGRHVATYGAAHDAGLHLKAPWPIHSALRLDRRLQIFDVPTQELLIRDRDEKTGMDKPLPLTFDVYVCWRIAEQVESGDGVDRFVRSFGAFERAESFLQSQIISRLKVELSELALAELINPDPSKRRTTELLERIRMQPPSKGLEGQQPQSLSQRALEVGIQVVDVRLRRFNHPLQVRDEIFAKIREQRKREASNYRLQGEEQATAIRAEGDLEARRIKADAEAEKRRLEGQAQAEALRILNEAHAQAPEFYRFIRLLEGYKQMFADDKTQLILSLDHPLLSLFKDLPRMLQKEPEKKP